MVWRGKGRRKAARALKGPSGDSEGQDAASPASKPKPPAPAPKAKSPTPAPSRRSSKRRDGGGRKGRRGEPRGERGGERRKGRRGDEDDDRGERGRVARPTSSPTPFIIGGGLVLAAIVIIVVASSGGKKSQRPADESSGTTSGGDSASTGYSSSSSSSAPAGPRGGSSRVEIRFIHKGLSPSGDNRHIVAACGRCGTKFTSRVDTCTNSSCGAVLRWDTRKRLKCKFCCPRDKLKVDDLDQIAETDRDGFCALCGGSGKDPKFRPEVRRGLFGLDKTRPGGDGGPGVAGGCPVCKGSNKCAKCEGSGWIDMPETFGP